MYVHDTFHHHLPLDKLESIEVGPKMLLAIRSLYSSQALSMKVAGTAGQPQLQQMNVRQGCPLDLGPTLFVLFFDGLHAHLRSCALAAGTQLRSGVYIYVWCIYMVSSLVCADHVVLLT